MNVFRQLNKKMQVTFIVGIFAFLFGLAGIFTASLPTRAASCDQVNIVYCGLTGSDVNGYISSVKQLYAANSNNGHTDIQQMFQWGGFSQAVINGMNTSNTKVGTLYRSGDIQVDGRTVATGTAISARFGGSGFTQIKDGVWSRPTTVSMANASEPVLVVFDANGKAIASMMIRCANTLQFVAAPSPAYSCDSLTLTPATQVVGGNVRATMAYKTINGAAATGFIFDWGDGSVITHNGYILDHTYAKAGTYTIRTAVQVVFPGGTATSNYCEKQITITPPMCTIPGKEQYPADAPECHADVPGVSITKTVIDDTQKLATVKVGQQYAYTLVVKNTGNTTLTNAVVTDSPHAGVTLVSTDLGSISNNSLTATIPSLGAGQTKTIHLKAVVSTYVSGTIQNDACVNAKEVNTPSNPANNDSCDKADVNVVKETHPAVTIVKTVNGKESDKVLLGKNFTYEVTVKNTGDVTLLSAVVSDPAPAGVTMVSATQGTIANNVWTYTIPSLAAGESQNFTITANVSTYKTGSIVNTACVNAVEVNPSTPAKADACDDATVTVEKVEHPSVTITKTVNNKKVDEVVLGDTYSYEVTVTNNGDIALTNVAVNDQPEAGVVLLSQVDGLGAIGNNQWTYTIPNLALNESKTFKFTAKVTEYHAKALVNTACVNAVEVNPTTPGKADACDTATVTVKVKNPAIAIVKTINGAKDAKLAVGTAFTYELAVKNTGEVALTNVVVSDSAPAGVRFTGADRGVIDANGNWTYTIPSLAVGETTHFVLNAKVTEHKDASIVNVACVNAPAVNPTTSDKQDACDSANLETPTVPQVLPETTVLPNTGAAGVVSLAAGVALLSSVFYSLVQSRKMARDDA